MKASSPESTPGTGQNTARGTGPARRLLGHRGVTEILGNHQAAPLAEQVTILDAALTAYRGEETRRDDMTLVAFRPRTLPRAT